MGYGLSDAYDCHVFLIDGGTELALIDVGAGLGVERIVENIVRSGFDPKDVRTVILTHCHADHAGGLARFCRALDRPIVVGSTVTRQRLETGDEHAVGLDVAKAAGYYPADYVLEPHALDAEVGAGDRIEIGNLALEVIETPGHCDGHVSLLVETGGKRSLFSGDAIFFGGNILLQNVPDCRLDAQIDTLRRLRSLEIEALIPSHLSFSLEDGQRHIERANDALDRLLIPNQLVNAW
jgi:glyoxylase-like metal-dependent hydrolase (beta-lactamase superfamily II)